ncbi:hypothetical protein [Streptomyces sp. NBC_00306]|uniref:hypothetical protein n=1 Tax=Streptomyces sp. NBC_00306 TaxID=2975708 RepID=UPI002E27B272|nr:hypothetical protein [Streptomyces sp. NBC_00306]
MKLVLDTDTITYEQAQRTLRSLYGRESSPEASVRRPPYSGKFVLEPLPGPATLGEEA